MRDFWESIVAFSGITIAIGGITTIATFLNMDSYNTLDQFMVMYGLGIIIVVIGIVFLNISLMKRDNVTHRELVERNRRNMINTFTNFGHPDSNNQNSR